MVNMWCLLFLIYKKYLRLGYDIQKVKISLFLDKSCWVLYILRFYLKKIKEIRKINKLLVLYKIFKEVLIFIVV